MKLQRASKASVVRAAFLFHGLAAIFCVVYTLQNSYYWFLGIGFVFLAMEMVLTYSYNEEGEWKWFVPSAFIYMAIVVPVVWFMELGSLNLRLLVKSRVGLEAECPVSISSVQINAFLCLNNNTSPYDEVVTPVEQRVYEMQQLYSTTLQQTLMLILILGRWLMPRGQLTRDQLSQLLLVYIGMAADMLEFSLETLKLEAIACMRDMFYVILGIWSWSLLQFTLGLTATKARKRRVFGKVARPPEDETARQEEKRRNSILGRAAISLWCCGTETWALMTSVILQDGPYLVIRLYLIIRFRIFDQSMIFFTCKNMLLLVLQFYRLYVVISETQKAHAQSSLRRRQSMLPMMKARSDDLQGRWPQNGSVYAIHPIPRANGEVEVGVR
ncbi:transmembrane protein 26-like [Diadema antillarum]|uniref:transmembrane protein 26-like n=1 Tax=Diadema antillarum TaxID=105358 RepID=UPI003A8B1772